MFRRIALIVATLVPIFSIAEDAKPEKKVPAFGANLVY